MSLVLFFLSGAGEVEPGGQGGGGSRGGEGACTKGIHILATHIGFLT